jgi:hypothetical protein
MTYKMNMRRSELQFGVWRTLLEKLQHKEFGDVPWKLGFERLRVRDNERVGESG